MNKENDESHKQPRGEQTSLQDYILYIAVGDKIYSPRAKEKDED